MGRKSSSDKGKRCKCKLTGSVTVILPPGYQPQAVPAAQVVPAVHGQSQSEGCRWCQSVADPPPKSSSPCKKTCGRCSSSKKKCVIL